MVLGKMKDETHGIPIDEFVGLRPKMYSILFTEDSNQVEKKTAKITRGETYLHCYRLLTCNNRIMSIGEYDIHLLK